jgi:hypothetical protein
MVGVCENRRFIIQSSFDQDDEGQTKGTNGHYGAYNARAVERLNLYVGTI